MAHIAFACPSKIRVSWTCNHAAMGDCSRQNLKGVSGMPQPSYVHGAGATPLIGATIGEYFDQIAERYAEHDALIVRHQQVRWSWRELKQRVDDFAAGLLALGLERGERIGIWSPNNAEWVVSQFATAKAGLILVAPPIG